MLLLEVLIHHGLVPAHRAFQATEPARVLGAAVTFEPGACTAWHTHPLGQTLIVTFGLGWAQRWGGPIEEIRPGDVIWFPPREKHWHGATATTGMTHIAIVEQLEGKALIGWKRSTPNNTSPDQGPTSMTSATHTEPDSHRTPVLAITLISHLKSVLNISIVITVKVAETSARARAMSLCLVQQKGRAL